MKKIFVAAPLTDLVRNYLGSHIAQMKNIKESDHLSWTQIENLHITIQFFGNVSEEQVARIKNNLKSLTVKYNKFNIELSGLGAFPNLKHSRVIYINVKDQTKTLKLIAGDVQACCQDDYEVHENREYVPHLTIARVRSPISRVESIFLPFEDKMRCPFEIQYISLYESRPVQGRSKYEELERYPLR